MCVNATGLIRSVAVSPSNWVAVGQSSGVMAVLDLRTGSIISSWKGHEGEVSIISPISNWTSLLKVVPI